MRGLPYSPFFGEGRGFLYKELSFFLLKDWLFNLSQYNFIKTLSREFQRTRNFILTKLSITQQQKNDDEDKLEQRYLFILIPLTWIPSQQKPLWLQQWNEAKVLATFQMIEHTIEPKILEDVFLLILRYCFVFNSKAESSEKVTQRTRCKSTIGQKGNKIHRFTQGSFSFYVSAFCFYPRVIERGSQSVNSICIWWIAVGT